jgi:hypothetical protein
MKLKYIHIIFGLFLFSFLLSCSNQAKLKNKLVHKKLFGGALDLTFQSSYGFMVFIFGHTTLFYSLEEKKMKKYLNEDVTSEQILRDLNSTKWVAEIKGCRFELYAFYNWVHYKYKKEIHFKKGQTFMSAKVIPVYMTDLTYSADLKYSKFNCEENKSIMIYHDVLLRPELNITCIEPLNRIETEEFLMIKDTLNRGRYVEYIKFNCH